MYVQRNIELPDEQRLAYEKLKATALILLKNDEVSYNNKLTELLKLQQVANGFVKTNDGNIIRISLRQTSKRIDEYIGGE